MMQSRVRIKVCGITQAKDALACARAGVDAIGLVFYEPSPRNVTLEQAKKIVEYLPPFVSVVGLFVNATPSTLATICTEVPLDLIQFHGDEAPDFCAQYSPRPWIKALPMRPDLDLVVTAEAYMAVGARGILLDAYVKGVPGGTGKTFDWARFPQTNTIPYILAGGLTPLNIKEAIAQTKPWAVDLSSGIELSAGIKDHQAIQELVLQTH